MSTWRQLALLLALLAVSGPAFGQTQISSTPTLTWQDAESGLDGFSVGRWISGGSEELIATVPATTFTYVDSGLTAGLTYCYHVYAFNRYGSSPPSTDACGTVTSATVGVTATSAPPPLAAVSSASNVEAIAAIGGGPGQSPAQNPSSTVASARVG